MRDLWRILLVNFRGHESALLLLRREPGDDLLEARIAAQRVPVRIQAQLMNGQDSDTRAMQRLCTNPSGRGQQHGRLKGHSRHIKPSW